MRETFSSKRRSVIYGCRGKAGGETGSGSSTMKQQAPDQTYPESTGMPLYPMAIVSQTHNGLHCLRPSSGSRGRCSRTKAGITEDPSSRQTPAYCPPALVVSPAGWSDATTSHLVNSTTPLQKSFSMIWLRSEEHTSELQ